MNINLRIICKTLRREDPLTSIALQNKFETQWNRVWDFPLNF